MRTPWKTSNNLQQSDHGYLPFMLLEEIKVARWFFICLDDFFPERAKFCN